MEGLDRRISILANRAMYTFFMCLAYTRLEILASTDIYTGSSVPVCLVVSRSKVENTVLISHFQRPELTKQNYSFTYIYVKVFCIILIVLIHIPILVKSPLILHVVS